MAGAAEQLRPENVSASRYCLVGPDSHHRFPVAFKIGFVYKNTVCTQEPTSSEKGNMLFLGMEGK